MGRRTLRPKSVLMLAVDWLLMVDE